MRHFSNGVLLAAALAVGVVAGCSDDASSDTRSVGADLLSSRTSTGEVPAIREEAEASMSPAPGAPREEDVGEIDLASLGHETGDPDAPLRIVEFSDFACGYCRTFHLETWPALEEEYVETGKVLWKYVPMILGIFGPNADEAALAGECAMEQGRFPALRDRLFEDQSRWKRDDDPLEIFREMAREEGLDVDRWQRCMEDGSRARRVDQGTALSRQAGIRGTPSFFIVGYGGFPGAAPLDLFREILDTVYAQETGADGAGPRAGPDGGTGGGDGGAGGGSGGSAGGDGGTG